MKKIILSSLVTSTLLLATQTPEQLTADIAQANADIESLQAKVVELTAQLPTNNSFITHSELGFIMTDGNTETISYNADISILKSFNEHKFKLTFNGQYAYDNTDKANSEIKNQYFTELTYNYSFTDSFAFTYLNGFKQDKFSNFDYQFYTGPGATYKLLTSDTQNLELEGNILYSVDNILGENTPQREEYSAYRAKVAYALQIVENLNFDQELSYRGSFEDEENYFVYSKSALSSKINDIFSAGLSYTLEYVNEAGEAEHTDGTLTASIIIDY
ncbi:MAG: DUF481 domain-containing protein [Campylobacterota bacterium]|nr:DUF481 domain-containing protein [Campylobacterota bacterium]